MNFFTVFRTKSHLPYTLKADGYSYVPAIGKGKEAMTNLLHAADYIDIDGRHINVSDFETVGVYPSGHEWWKALM